MLLPQGSALSVIRNNFLAKLIHFYSFEEVRRRFDEDRNYVKRHFP